MQKEIESIKKRMTIRNKDKKKKKTHQGTKRGAGRMFRKIETQRGEKRLRLSVSTRRRRKRERNRDGERKRIEISFSPHTYFLSFPVSPRDSDFVWFSSLLLSLLSLSSFCFHQCCVPTAFSGFGVRF